MVVVDSDDKNVAVTRRRLTLWCPLLPLWVQL